MSAEPFSAQASLSFPPDDGKPLASIVEALAGTFEQKVDDKLKFTTTGPHVIGMGSIITPGAKVLLIEYEATRGTENQQPIAVAINGGLVPLELTPGGFLLLANPVPVAGVTAVTITNTGIANVRVRVLG
jgi:hypothetical protein